MLQSRVFPDHEAVSRFAADWLCELLSERPSALICLATGSTPMRTYEILAQRGGAEPSLFQSVRVLLLDEWGGLSPTDPQSCDASLCRSFITPLGISDRYVAFHCDPADPAAECARIARWLEHNGPIDACLLGLGLNGHVGFNEPAEFLAAHAHVAKLSQETLAHAMVRTSPTPPTYGLTLGMADLVQSRSALMLVTGPTKRAALARLLNGKITTSFPASFLQLHASALVACDAAAFVAS